MAGCQITLANAAAISDGSDLARRRKLSILQIGATFDCRTRTSKSVNGEAEEEERPARLTDTEMVTAGRQNAEMGL